MKDPTNQQARCEKLVSKLNAELHWNLSSEQATILTEHILPYIPTPCTEAKLRHIIIAYHDDASLVQALSDPAHPNHSHAWTQWRAQVTAILNYTRLNWSSDIALESDDMVQIACSELAQALPKFRYASHFATWARQVVVKRVQRAVRDTRAGKRAERPASLEQLPESEAFILDEEPLTSRTETHLFIEQIKRVLAEQPDKRLLHIFYLRVLQDERMDDIGKLIQIHPTRVRQLMNQMCHLLYQHPDIMQWLSGAAEEDNHGQVEGPHDDSQKDV